VKTSIKAVKRSVKMMLYSIVLVLFEKGLTPEFVAEWRHYAFVYSLFIYKIIKLSLNCYVAWPERVM
jgi:hypothetical protein